MSDNLPSYAELMKNAKSISEPHPDQVVEAHNDGILDTLKSGANDVLGTVGDVTRGAVQGATLGFSDEALGAVQAGLGKLSGDNRSIEDLYKQYRDIERAKNEAANKSSPVLNTVGEMVGGIIPTVLTGGAALPESLGMTAAKMAGVGAVNAAGVSNADNVDDITKDALIGGGMGAVTTGALGLAGKGLSKIAESEPVQNAVDTFAKKYLGFNKNTNMVDQGIRKGAVKELSEANPLTKKARDIVENSKSYDEAMSQINSKLGESKETANKLLSDNADAFNGADDIYGKYKDILMKDSSALENNPTASVEGRNSALKLRQDYLSEFDKFKNDPQKLANWVSDLNQAAKNFGTKSETSNQSVAQDMAQKVSGYLEDVMNTTGDDAGSAFRQARRDMSDYFNINDALQNKIAKPLENDLNYASHGGAMTGGTLGAIIGGSMGGPVGAAVGGGLGSGVGSKANVLKAAMSKISPTEKVDRGLFNLAKSMQSAPEKLIQRAPLIHSVSREVTNSYIQSLRNSNDPTKMQMADRLETAVNEKDSPKQNAIMFDALQKDPSLREEIKKEE